MSRRNGIARRIYDALVVKRTPLWTLFDTGAQRSYITQAAAKRSGLTPQKIGRTFPVGLGGKVRKITESVDLVGTLHRLPLQLHLFVLDNLGKDDAGRPIDVLFGILAMEEWGVEPDVKRKRLDLSHFTKELIEYAET